jgi:putative FmdB family regulatory protein
VRSDVPTYEYACTACEDRFEIVQSFADAALTECRACGGRLRKVFSPVGVVFTGSGFYKTDSRAASPATGSKPGSKPDEAKTAGDGTPKADPPKAAGTSATGGGGAPTTPAAATP